MGRPVKTSLFFFFFLFFGGGITEMAGTFIRNSLSCYINSEFCQGGNWSMRGTRQQTNMIDLIFQETEYLKMCVFYIMSNYGLLVILFDTRQKHGYHGAGNYLSI